MGKLGDATRSLLRERGLSQRDLVRVGGPSLSSVTRFMAGDDIGEFHPSTVQAIAKSLGMNYVDLVNRLKPGSIRQLPPPDSPPPDKETPMPPLTTDSFLAWFESLPPARQRSIYGAVRAHVDEHWAASNLTPPHPARISRRTG